MTKRNRVSGAKNSRPNTQAHCVAFALLLGRGVSVDKKADTHRLDQVHTHFIEL